MAGQMWRRDIASTIEGVPQTFSSWNSCMSKAYCKWPAIIGIVIASLMVLSIVWCLARCLCCGAACCCSCLRCLDCFTPNRHGRERSTRHKDDYTPMPPQAYQPMPSPMIYQPNAPQYASFDVPGRKIHEDSLPINPSWDTAHKRHVEDTSHHGDDVELGQMSPQPQRGNGYNQVPNGPVSPVAAPSPYAYNAKTEYFGAAGVAAGSHLYNSDLGAQRLGPPQPPQAFRHQSYADSFQTAPTSPAPAYALEEPGIDGALLAGATHHSVDRFAPGTASPMPEHYNNRNHGGYDQQPQTRPRRQNSNNFSRPAPYAPSLNTSTRYEPTEYNHGPGYTSPTQARAPPQSYSGYAPQEQSYGNGGGFPSPYPSTSPTRGQAQSQAQSQRPPSLLQVGRKPVNGSIREI